MKKFCLILVSLIFFLSISNATNYSSDPEKFISELVEDAISKLSNKKISDEEKSDYIEKIALENVDIKALGLYTIGEIRKSAKKTDLEKYQIVFEKYFLKSLTSRLKEYSSNKFEIISADVKSSNYTIIKSKILGSENQPEIKIDWRVYTKDPAKPLIRDLIVEGLSLARTQKEEFSSILNSNDNDISILISKLEEFVNS
ncbi:MAG: phospholipid-binding protein MlaC [Pelagibacteraceae bacterium]